MGSEANVVQLDNGEAHLVKVDENCDKLESVDVVKHSLPSMIPVSPDLRNEGLNLSPEFVSPKTVLTLPQESSGVDSHQKCYGTGSPDAGSPCTPKDGFFDPFAPGVDDLMLAPRSSKYFSEPRSSAARSLNFGALLKVAIEGNCESDVETILEEEKLLEILYDDLLEVILSTQVASIQQGTSLDEVLGKHTVLDGYKTPELLIRGAADSCPPAPLKFGRKLVNINKGLCRKLEF
ncbi:cyclin-dependent protein kinase inhibitor SMR11 [Apium graveolens]|uniref:cyclin-dependent protein kinase inhibitor SMR11 n=1 Tax=Apium graveolens TaxID=4045 RepID=UPI003D78E2BE